MPVIHKSVSFAETPKDAVILTRSHAAQHVYDAIADLKFSQNWPLKVSLAALFVTSGLSSLLITQRIRTLFKIGRYGYIMTAIPAAYVPMIGSYLFYRFDVMQPILLQEKMCPTCLQVQSMGVQLTAGVIYPFLASYAITYATASNIGSITAPALKMIKDPSSRREMFEIFKRTTQKLSSRLVTLSILQCVVACGAVMVQMYTIDDMIAQVEKTRLENIEEIARQQKERNYKEQTKSSLTVY
uniref:Uncharacterized protein n=2 Tax=Cacopsylla melanoneura TaxID=428564 RepID=A0A8D8RZY1_9HEMI